MSGLRSWTIFDIVYGISLPNIVSKRIFTLRFHRYTENSQPLFCTQCIMALNRRYIHVFLIHQSVRHCLTGALELGGLQLHPEQEHNFHEIYWEAVNCLLFVLTL